LEPEAKLHAYVLRQPCENLKCKHGYSRVWGNTEDFGKPDVCSWLGCRYDEMIPCGKCVPCVVKGMKS